MKPAAKVVFYCRKSSDSEDRQALSIPAQIQECYRLAEKYKIPKTNIIEIQESQSAKLPGRPLFNQMVLQINKGEIDQIFCWKLDRLSRNPIEGASIIWLLEQRLIKKIITPSQHYNPEDNHILMYLEFGMASQYSRDLSVNVKRGNKMKLETGWWSTVAPLGYLNNPDKRGDPIIKDPDRFELVKQLWKLMLTKNYTGLQLLKIARETMHLTTLKRQKQGGQLLARSSLYRIFNNPFYYGYMIRGENEGMGKHEPMITKEEFEIVQTLLGRHGTTRPKEKLFPYRNHIFCGECACHVTIEDTINRHGQKYTYYHCSKRKVLQKANHTGFKCSQKSIRLEHLEAQLLEFLSRIRVPAEFDGWVTKNLTGLSIPDEEIQQRHNSLQKAYDKNQQQIQNLLTVLINKTITEQEYTKMKDELESKKNKIELDLNQIKPQIDRNFDLVKRVFRAIRKPKIFFTDAFENEKTKFFKLLSSQILLKEQVISIHWNPSMMPFLENDSASEHSKTA